MSHTIADYKAEWLNYVLPAVTAFLCNVSAGTTGFGQAILFHVLWQIWWLFFDTKHRGDMVQFLRYNIMGTSGSILLFALVFKKVKWKLWASLMPGIVIFSLLGAYTLLKTPPLALRISLGVMFILFTIYRILIDVNRTHLGTKFREYFKLETSSYGVAPTKIQQVFARMFPKELKNDTLENGITLTMCIAAVITSCASGFLRGIAGPGGPPLMIFVILFQLDKTVIRAVVSALGILTCIAVDVYLLAYKKQFKVEDWPQYVILAVFAWIGLIVGNFLHHRIDTQFVLRILLVLLVVASIVMFNIPAIALLCILGIAAITGIIVATYLLVKRILIKKYTHKLLVNQEEELGAFDRVASKMLESDISDADNISLEDKDSASDEEQSFSVDDDSSSDDDDPFSLRELSSDEEPFFMNEEEDGHYGGLTDNEANADNEENEEDEDEEDEDVEPFRLEVINHAGDIVFSRDSPRYNEEELALDEAESDNEQALNYESD